MALISCPECGKEISDKVKVCPHCGYPFEQETEISEKPQPVTVTSISLGKHDPVKKKKIILGIVAIFAVIIIATISIIITNNIHKKNARNDYIDNLSFVQTLMLSGASDAETLGGLAHDVWYNTIYEEYDAKTDKYTRSGFSFNSDFNDSLKNLYSDKTTTDSISDIKSTTSSVTPIMRKLQNPDKEFETCFNTVTEMYKDYQTLADLATSPSGNLQNFTDNFNKADSDFMQQYNLLKSQIPEKVK